MKFGGTSVGSADAIQRAAALVREAAQSHRVLVVLSAMSGVTDSIVAALEAARSGISSEVICESLRKRHLEAVTELLGTEHPKAVDDAVHSVVDRLAEICSSVVKVQVLPSQIADMAL